MSIISIINLLSGGALLSLGFYHLLFFSIEQRRYILDFSLTTLMFSLMFFFETYTRDNSYLTGGMFQFFPVVHLLASLFAGFFIYSFFISYFKVNKIRILFYFFIFYVLIVIGVVIFLFIQDIAYFNRIDVISVNYISYAFLSFVIGYLLVVIFSKGYSKKSHIDYSILFPFIILNLLLIFQIIAYFFESSSFIASNFSYYLAVFFIIAFFVLRDVYDKKDVFEKVLVDDKIKSEGKHSTRKINEFSSKGVDPDVMEETENFNNEKNKGKIFNETENEILKESIQLNRYIAKNVGQYNEIEKDYRKIDLMEECIGYGFFVRPYLDELMKVIFNFGYLESRSLPNIEMKISGHGKTMNLTLKEFFISNDHNNTVEMMKIEQLKEVVAKLNGKFLITKENVDKKGVVFKIDLPVESITHKKTSKNEAGHNSGKRILLITNDIKMYEVLNSLLKEHNTEHFIDVNQAVKYAEKNEREYALVIAAFYNANDNVNVLYETTRSDRLNKVPFIFLSKKKQDLDDWVKVRPSGIYNYILPIEKKRFSEFLSNIKESDTLANVTNRMKKLEENLDEFNSDRPGNSVRVNVETFFNDKSLSKDEKRVTLLLLKGYENNRIAKEVSMTEDRIFALVTGIFEKAGVKGRLELINFLSNGG